MYLYNQLLVLLTTRFANSSLEIIQTSVVVDNPIRTGVAKISALELCEHLREKATLSTLYVQSKE